jgi:hypothetical protein
MSMCVQVRDLVIVADAGGSTCMLFHRPIFKSSVASDDALSIALKQSAQASVTCLLSIRRPIRLAISRGTIVLFSNSNASSFGITHLKSYEAQKV